MSAVALVMPRLSDSMEEGTILRWLKAEGDRVTRGEEVVEIETDKATMAYASDADGFLHVLAREGETLPVGAPIAELGPEAIGGEPGAAAEHTPEPARDDSNGTSASAPPAGREGSAPREESERIRASPLARRLAREQGVALESVIGSGPGGRVVRVDVEAFASASASAPASAAAPAPAPVAAEPAPATDTARGPATVLEPTRGQRAVARRMAESRATVPDFTVAVEVEMTEARRLREGLVAVASTTPAPSLNDMVIRACGLALGEFPRINASYRDGHFELHPRINIGIAVSAEDHLTVPVVHDAAERSLGELAILTRALAARVRDGTVTPPQLAGATFTISNLGMLGADRFTAIITPPQAAILAVGAARPRPVLRDGVLSSGLLMELTMACDHRIVYGAEAARFLARLRELLEAPLALI